MLPAVPPPANLLRFFPQQQAEDAAKMSVSSRAADDAKLFADENNCVIRRWINRYNVSHGVAFANWRSNEDARLAQAEGYALAFKANAVFVRDPFLSARLAFGVSIFPVVSNARYKDRIPDDVAKSIRKAWRAFIPEDSAAHTHVPRLAADGESGATTPWIAALTAGGSVRLMKMRGPSTEVWYLYVASGIPRALEEEVIRAMAEWQGGIPDLSHTRTTGMKTASLVPPRTYEDVARTDFARLVEISKENRARIACAAAAHAGFTFVDLARALEPKHPAVAFDYTSRQNAGDAPPWTRALVAGSAQEKDTIESALSAFAALDLRATQRVPIWYRDPQSKFALGEALMHASVRAACGVPDPETCAYTVQAYVDCTWNVLVEASPQHGAPSSAGAIWLSECAPAWDPQAHSVVVFDDPVCSDVCVLNWRAHVPASAGVAERHAVNIATLGAYPNVVARALPKPRDIDETNEGLSVELEKHFTRSGPARTHHHPMVMAAWRTQTHADGAPPDAWQFSGSRAAFGTELAMHAERAYDLRLALPTKLETEFDGVAN